MAKISEIRLQMAQDHGVSGLPVCTGGLFGNSCDGSRSAPGPCLPDPMSEIGSYLTLWMVTAILSFTAAGIEMAYRTWRTDRPLQRELTLLAVEQFLPSMVAGAMLTYVIVRSAPGQVWMLPGLWCVIFSLGIFASYRLLPHATFWIALYYLVSGSICLMVAQGTYALSPWTMGLSFGVGQLLAAGVLYWKLERRHG